MDEAAMAMSAHVETLKRWVDEAKCDVPDHGGGVICETCDLRAAIRAMLQTNAVLSRAL